MLEFLYEMEYSMWHRNLDCICRLLYPASLFRKQVFLPREGLIEGAYKAVCCFFPQAQGCGFCACICVGSGDGFRNCVFLLSYGRFCFSDAQGTACSCVDRFFSVCLVLTFCNVRHSGFFGLPSGDLWNLLLEGLSPWICIRRADNVLPGLGLADSVFSAAWRRHPAHPVLALAAMCAGAAGIGSCGCCRLWAAGTGCRRVLPCVSSLLAVH